MAASPAYTLTGTFSSLIGSDTGYVTIRLSGYSPQIPRISGGVLNTVFYQTALGSSFSVTLYGNDQIVPGSTFYSISLFDTNGRPLQQNVPYLLQGSGTFDLSSLTPMVAAPPSIPTPPSTVNQNLFLAGPINGTAAPAYRVIAPADLQADIYSTAWQVVDGVEVQTIQQAIAALPASGGTIDMRFNSTSAALALGTVDSGSKPLTLLLGPYNYTLTQMTIREGLHVIGAGSGQTFITATSGSTNLFVLGDAPSQHVLFKGLNISGGASSVDCFHIIAQTGGGGLWYSQFEDLVVGAGTTFGSTGNCFHFDGNNTPAGDAINQFISFRDVVAFRAVSAAPAFLASGLNGQFSFDDCEFDCAAVSNSDNGINFEINDGTQTFRAPYSFDLRNVTFQQAWGPNGCAVRLAGVNDVNIITGHFENDTGAIKAVSGTTYATLNVNVIGGSFDGNTGINGGNGYILFLDSVSSAVWMGNSVASTPDTFFAGTPTFLTVTPSMNSFGGGIQPQPSQVPNEFLAKRFGSVNGTNLTSGNISLSAGWGTSPSITAVKGTSAGFDITIQSGTGSPTANPSFTITFPDGAWSNPPVVVCSRADASSPAGGYWAPSLPGSASSVAFVFVGTPSASTGYALTAILMDKQN